MNKIYFRADASAAIGYGHFIRTLALADMLKEDFDCTFFTCHPTSYQVSEMEKVCSYVTLQEETHYDDFLSYLNGDEIVVLDNYYYTSQYQKQIKQKGCKLVCIDDVPEKHFFADLIINHSLCVSASDYDCEDYTSICVGMDYLLLRKEFLDATKMQFSGIRSSIFICYGGSDEFDFSLKSCKLLRGLDDRHIIVVIGGGYCNKEELQRYAEDNNISVFSNIDANQMIKLMSLSSLAVVPASTTFFEACCARLPIITGYTVDNQRMIASCCEKYSLGYNCGDFHKGFDDKLKAAYSAIDEKHIEEYIFSQNRLINDSSENILNLFRELC
ncbi:UDP-2,4-diacetamido-2,4,6-trideoxy-beta-L-altropyranose hydrolase [Bacteroides helcogenes]|uniref:Pseudaminic acid biosynthesis-associated protein PseG n=1 Tax=Bacteroides helcogenes (strain ATCC 35417 / DSM 20613 / JCM 6297 / CCUG 15421 / P 36-108) TaxID=693979 RepID=E6SQ62_BACT6|nr:UDP-2,4-diacetamido-2,4,6-trideoxy-beta-L-altropyranose hydrolase [Bacteroides helcogenes]ADV43921.1 pseudaminic acid biosynthesis-associated protein PseG [Bacteroides helcogenes P 36-108]MDY5237362.1 UDP-2,4-diacetamido-2,4,6-trideoxy-beta-L-altropyranose hydrolase [Bacteroides helcogenes]